MAINTSGYAVNGSIPTLIGPTTKPVVFNYANGQTMAPTSGGQAYANGMIGLGKSLGDALQESAQNLNANTIAKNEAARAQAQMQTQLTPMQQALAQAQLARDTGQANYFTGIWGQQNQAQQQLLAQRAAQQAQAQQSVQGSPMPGSHSSNAPSSQMPSPQSNGLIGLNPANASVVQAGQNPNSYSVNSSIGAQPSSIGMIIPDLAGTGLKYDELSQKSQQMAQANTNIDAKQAADVFNSNDVVKNYELAASNANILYQAQQKLNAGQSLTPAEGENVKNAYASLVDPSKGAQKGAANDLIKSAPITQQVDAYLQNFKPNANTSLSDQVALDATKVGISNYQNIKNQFRAIQMTGIAQSRNTNIDTPQQLAKIYPDKPSIAEQQYGWGQQKKQKATPEQIQSLAQKARAIHAANPNLSQDQVMKMANGSQ